MPVRSRTIWRAYKSPARAAVDGDRQDRGEERQALKAQNRAQYVGTTFNAPSPYQRQFFLLLSSFGALRDLQNTHVRTNPLRFSIVVMAYRRCHQNMQR
jgi:hypothetical protein